jgi:hypothetical protein
MANWEVCRAAMAEVRSAVFDPHAYRIDSPRDATLINVSGTMEPTVAG